ncbi:hypothetical protein [Cellulomonas sp. ICMP 17802]|uniref:hypothetical protein n=1 Tax=Cellulomonas sp. ICMP 17802 TaxID=3239199 RepID=UPI00351BDB59
MTTAPVSRRAHLETVIEFEMEPDPVGTPSPDLGERAAHVRRLVGIVGAAVGVVVAGSVAAGIATTPAPHRPAAVATLSTTHVRVVASCHAVGTVALRAGEPHLRCTVAAPDSPSAEVAMRAADEAAEARARAWAETHGPGTGTTRRWSSFD